MQPMTTAEATEILNRFKHHDHSGWYVLGDGDNADVCGEDRYEFFTPFEAVAIAAALLAREKGEGHE